MILTSLAVTDGDIPLRQQRVPRLDHRQLPGPTLGTRPPGTLSHLRRGRGGGRRRRRLVVGLSRQEHPSGSERNKQHAMPQTDGKEGGGGGIRQSYCSRNTLLRLRKRDSLSPSASESTHVTSKQKKTLRKLTSSMHASECIHRNVAYWLA